MSLQLLKNTALKLWRGSFTTCVIEPVLVKEERVGFRPTCDPVVELPFTVDAIEKVIKLGQLLVIHIL